MKKKLFKYQFAGETISTPINTGYNGEAPQFINGDPLNMQPKRKQEYDYSMGNISPTFQAINAIALGTGAIAGTINEYNTRKQERKTYINSLTDPYNFQNPVQNDQPIYTKYGGKAKYGIDETNGLSSRKNATIEAEGGEVYQQPDGNVVKISDSAPSHEQGGVPINNVARVLEDTSTTRKDENSKALRLTPDMVNGLFGVKPKKSLSHSEALEFVNDKLENHKKTSYNKFNTTLAILEDNPNDKYANNSLDLNAVYIDTLPTKEAIFEKLFNNQESIKSSMNIQNGKAKYGVDLPQAYTGGITLDDVLLNKPDKGGGKTPTGRNNMDYNFTADEINRYAKKLGLRIDTNKNFQTDLYNLASKVNPKSIEKMWTGDGTIKGFGNTNKGINTKENMNINAFADGDVKARTMFLLGEVLKNTPPEQTVNTPIVPPTLNATPQSIPDQTTNIEPEQDEPQATSQFSFKQGKPSKFNEPLHWYDLAAETIGLLDNERVPTTMNPVEFNKVSPKLLNPLPALQAGQRDFNAVTSRLPSTGAGMANATNAFSQKYAIDNQVIGQYDNQNNQIENQARYYNASVDDRQSQADAQTRETFERKQLGSMEAQRQQKMTYLDSIFTKIAQNNALNRNGNLVQQLSPNFNQYGEYNGNQRYFTTNTQATPSTGNGIQYVTDPNSGMRFRVMIGPDGKLISASKAVLTDNKAIGARGK